MLIEANPSEIRAILGAMQQVITARNRLPVSEIDEKTLSGAYQYMFGQTGDLDIGALPGITPNELASTLTDRELSINALRFMAVCAFVDGALNKQRIDTVLDFAKALDIREDYIAELTALAHDDLRWVMADMSRRNIESLINHPWTDDDANAWLLPYRGRSADPGLAARYEDLRDCPDGSLGKAFWHHFKDNGYPFPGEPDGLNEIFATPHDSTHILSGYNTTFQGEILVSTFTAGMHQREPMAGHVLPVILLWHLGLRFNEVARSGMGWLDLEKFWVAWKRGCDTKADLFQPEWDFWAAANRPLASLRAEYAIEPLPPQFAAVDSNDR